MKFGTWHVRSPYRIGSLKTVARGLAKYSLFLAAVQQVRGEIVTVSQQMITHLSPEMGNANRHLGTGTYVHQRIISAVMKVKKVRNDRYHVQY